MHAYNAFGEVTQTTQAIAGSTTRVDQTTYDQRGQATQTRADPSGINVTTSTDYDAFGREVRNVDGNGNVATRSYDRLGRVIAQTRGAIPSLNGAGVVFGGTVGDTAGLPSHDQIAGKIVVLKSAPGGGFGGGRPGGGGRGGFAALRALSDAAAIVMVTDALSPAAVRAATHPREGDVMMKPTGNAPGGQLTITTMVENWPGHRDGVMGPQLMADMRAQAEHFGTAFRTGLVERVDFGSHPFTLTLDDGRTLVKEVEFPRGHAGNPMTDAEVERKFRTLVEPKYGKVKADVVLARCWDLENLTSVTDLIRLLD